MWTKREAEWERERLARERLMAEVQKLCVQRTGAARTVMSDGRKAADCRGRSPIQRLSGLVLSRLYLDRARRTKPKKHFQRRKTKVIYQSLPLFSPSFHPSRSHHQ